MQLKTRNGTPLSSIGLGCMAMSGAYAEANRRDGIETIHAELKNGVNVFDTGDFYGSGHNEMLLQEALQGTPRDSVFIAVKFGALKTPDGGFSGIDGRPSSVKNFLTYSLQRLGTDYIDLYQPARLDPNVPIEETIGALSDLVEAGYIRHIGLSEVGPDTIRRAQSVHPIASLQVEYSLFNRGIEDEILPLLEEMQITLNPHGILAKGLLGGKWSKDRSNQPRDPRTRLPQFSGDNLAHNLNLVEALRQVAEARNASVAQLAIAWVLSRAESVLPLIGARRPDQLQDALLAANLKLSPRDLQAIEQAIPKNAVAGDRSSRFSENR